MKVINIYTSGNYEKFNAIKQLGYIVKNEGDYLVLMHKKYDVSKYVDPYFHHVNEILNVLKDQLLRNGYKITA